MIQLVLISCQVVKAQFSYKAAIRVNSGLYFYVFSVQSMGSTKDLSYVGCASGIDVPVGIFAGVEEICNRATN